MAKKKEVSILEDMLEGEPVEEAGNDQEVESDSEVVKIKYAGSNPSFTIGKVIFTPDMTMELHKDLADIALRNEGFKKVK